MLALQDLHQPGAAQHLCVQPLGGQKQNREVGGVRRLDVFFGHGLGLQADAQLQRFACGFCAQHIGVALGIQQALVVFVRKLGIYRQPQWRTVDGFARQFDGKVHHVFTARLGGDLRTVLVDREDLLQQTGQLRLAKNTARFDIGEQMLEVTHALRQRLHLAQAFVDLLQPVGYLFEALTQARLQGGL